MRPAVGGTRHGLWRVAAMSALVAMAAPSAAQPLTASAAALRLRDVTPTAQHAALMQPFTLEARSDWHYTPRRRAGIAWKEMSDAQRSATTELLRSALNESGLDKVRAVMALEIALRELETFGLQRDPDNYAVALYGEPNASDKGWGWRIEGHHLSLHWTLQGDRYVATLPQFFGANPARVPRDFGQRVRAGTRVLGNEEDLARTLLLSLSPQQRSRAIFDTRPYGDIVTRNAERAAAPQTQGIAFASLSAAQQAQLLSLITAFAEHLRPELVEARLARVRAQRWPADAALRMGRRERARPAVLLSRAGRRLPDRVRQLRWQSRALGVARLQRRLGPRRARRPLPRRRPRPPSRLELTCAVPERRRVLVLQRNAALDDRARCVPRLG